MVKVLVSEKESLRWHVRMSLALPVNRGELNVPDDDESSCRTTRESSSGSHLGHDKAETTGDSESRATAKWPADRWAFMMGDLLESAKRSRQTTPRTKHGIPLLDHQIRFREPLVRLPRISYVVVTSADRGRVQDVARRYFGAAPIIGRPKNQACANGVEKNKMNLEHRTDRLGSW
jgi:hypothetical protein